MMEETVRLGRFADDKVHNSEFYRFNSIQVVRFHEAANFSFLSKLWYKQTVLSPVKTVLNFPVELG